MNAPPISPRAAWAGVALLFLVYAISFVDRQIMSLLVAPIRADLRISDTQLSLLHGLAFALFYALVGLPIGRWVDRGRRPSILSAGIAAWSIFTMLCGRAGSFGELFAFRVGVGAGEGTVAPVTYSLLADYFPPERRGLAMGLFGAGVYVGMGGALMAGALVIGLVQRAAPIVWPIFGVLAPWRLAFLAVGLPGLLLYLAVLALPEPRGRAMASSSAPPAWPAVKAHFRRAGPALVAHHGATALMAMVLYGITAWAPELLRRRFGLPVTTVGLWTGAVVLGAGLLGVLAAGAASDHLLRRGVVAARLWLLIACALGAAPGCLLFAFAERPGLALAGLAAAVMGLAGLTTLGPAGVQELHPARLRGLGSAIFQLVVTVVGLGFGPTLVAAVSDAGFGGGHLASAIALTSPGLLVLAAGAAVLGIPPYRRQVSAAALNVSS